MTSRPFDPVIVCLMILFLEFFVVVRVMPELIVYSICLRSGIAVWFDLECLANSLRAMPADADAPPVFAAVQRTGLPSAGGVGGWERSARVDGQPQLDQT